MAAIDFNYERIMAALGLPIPPQLAAAIIGVNNDDYNAYVFEIDETNQTTATEMLKNPKVAALVEYFSTNVKNLMALGDSITAYRYSYIEVLRHMLVPRGLQIYNCGVGGYTSNHALELCYNPEVLELDPDFIFISYGVNDNKYFGDIGKTLVSYDEYIVNMTAIVQTLQRYTKARLVLLTPTPVIEEQANNLRPSSQVSRIWRNSEIKRFGDGLQEIGAGHGVAVVDMFAGLGMQPDPKYYLEDGLHPNPLGERFMLEQIAEQLSF